MGQLDSGGWCSIETETQQGDVVALRIITLVFGQGGLEGCALLGQWQLRGYGRWIVTLRGDDAPIGLVGLFEPIDWPGQEMSWAVFPGVEGRGIATEAARAARRWWYALGNGTLISHVAPGPAPLLGGALVAVAALVALVAAARARRPRAAGAAALPMM